MKNRFHLLAIALTLVFVSGCATNGSNSQYTKPLCVIAGAVVGGAAGSAAEDDDEGAAIGAVTGGVIAWLFCNAGNDEDGDGVPDDEDRCRGTTKGAAVGSDGCELDRDGDGVPDNRDNCPDTPRGVRVDSNGCALDSDGDGVTDDKDRCPGTPAGVEVNSSGCPMDRDSDGDGVKDSVDKCPKTPAGKTVNNSGCHTVLSLKGVNFALNSSKLGPQAATELDRAVKMLKADSMAKLKVEGHTDSTGEESYNQWLSQKRAEAVVDYLAKNGIDRARLMPMGYGEARPVAGNDTTAGRASNRRVDLVANN